MSAERPDTPADRLTPAERFARDGVLVVPGLLSPAALAGLRRRFADPAPPGRGGVRGLLDDSPEVRSVAVSPAVRGLAAGLIGGDCVAVRATLFDKTAAANWSVPWHRDERLAFAGPVDSPDLTAWKRAGGVWTAKLTRAFLRRAVAVRLHLDDCGPADGRLRVAVGSHRGGGRDEARRVLECTVPAGGAVALCPAARHASGKATVPGRRRVIHVEYAPPNPPGGAAWRHALRPVAPAAGFGVARPAPAVRRAFP